MSFLANLNEAVDTFYSSERRRIEAIPNEDLSESFMAALAIAEKSDKATLASVARLAENVMPKGDG